MLDNKGYFLLCRGVRTICTYKVLHSFSLYALYICGGDPDGIYQNGWQK